MGSTPSAEAAATADPEVFEQGPLVPRGVIGFPLLWVVGGTVYAAITDAPLDRRALLILLAVVAGVSAVIAIAVLPQSMKSVRVDPRGLHVKGRLEVPARRLGRVRVLTGRQAATWSWPGSRARGGERLPSRQNLYGGLYGFGPAVGVEDTDPDDPTVWLIPSRDAARLAACLESARDHA